MLKEVIAESEAIYLSKVDELAALQQRLWTHIKDPSKLPDVRENTVREWLAKVMHNPSGRHRKLQRYATAYYRDQKIIYNPLFIAAQSRDDLLDTVLHELGHLFTWRFFGYVGHGAPWKMVGTIVGYAEVGATRLSRRQQYRSYAAHSGAVQTTESPLGQISAITEVNRSTIRSPVATVHYVCNRFPTGTRKEIIDYCVSLGVNRNTAATQYAAWKRNHRSW